MIGEVLAGIALVNKAHKTIKELCGNVSDIGGLAKHIDDLFAGDKQIQKDRNKAGQPLSIKSVAEETINARLAQERMYEISQMIDLRFGHGTWTGIINERAARIQEQKDHDREVRRMKRKRQLEFQESAKTVGIVLTSILTLCGVLFGVVFYNLTDR